MKRALDQILPFAACLLIAGIGGGILALIAGENPIFIYSILLKGSFGSLEGLGYTLFYATPFIFAGLAVAVPYQAGLFNIGGEGQIYFGALVMTWVATWLPEWGIASLSILIISAMLGGALWASLPGLFKAFRGSHEVITTIMLNFIAMSLSNYCILYWWKDPSIQRPESFVYATNFHLPQWSMGGAPLNMSFALAVLSAVVIYALLKKTTLGFRWRATGLNAVASKTAGISTKWAMVSSMMLGGALASGVAVNDILGHAHRLRDGFTQGYGFIGIAVAFLGRLHPIGIIFSAIFFGALQHGAGELDFETNTMTRDFAVVLQAILIAAVASEYWIRNYFLKRRRARDH